MSKSFVKNAIQAIVAAFGDPTAAGMNAGSHARKKDGQQGQQPAEVVAGGGEDGVGGLAVGVGEVEAT